MTLADILASLVTVLAEAPDEVVCGYLFGSQARGTARSDSDVDVAILTRTAPPTQLQGPLPELEGRLERALGRRVQLVVLNHAPPDLVHRVLRDGQVVLDRDKAARIRFEVRSRNEYFDLLPVIRRYRARALARAAQAVGR